MTKQRPPRPAADVCVVYCRVSSEKQATEDKGSLDAQERTGLAKATELGLRVLYVVKDAESAWVLDKRSKFQAVLNDAKAGKFSTMIVDRMNRFTRAEDLGEYMQVMTELRGAGVRLVFSQRDYDNTPTGQFQQMVDAYVSAQEQANRRAQSLTGKRTRAHTHHQPIPGARAPYGYTWTDDRKTQLAKSGDEAQGTVERIWSYFLHGEHPTLRKLAHTLTAEGVRPPRAYQGMANAGNRWTTETIRLLLHNPVYCGGNEDGNVTTFTDSKYNQPVTIPAYAPPYVARADALRIRARLSANQQYAARNRKHDWGVLLQSGMARCGECGWALEVHPNSRTRADGSRLLLYRCPQSSQHGKRFCEGVSISAEVLDTAVELCLNDNLNNGEFLTRLFAAWDRDQDAALGSVRNVQQTLDETTEQIANGAARLFKLAPGDPLGAPLETQMRLLQETVPGMEARLANARAAVQTAHANTGLRQELIDWFDGWMVGFYALPLAKQQDFLKAIRAEVRLWREGEREPRAQLLIRLPSSALQLPLPPQVGDAWALPVDVPAAQAHVAYMTREELASFAATAELDMAARRNDNVTAEEVMTDILLDLAEQGIVTSRPRRPRTAAAAIRSQSRECRERRSTSVPVPAAHGVAAETAE
jgi:site-specific DNA recombinase